MTKPVMDLREVVEKIGDADLLREMIGFATGRLMELEVGGQTGAAYREKSPERLAKRNGDRDRDWQTRAGNVELRIPKMRTGSYFPSFLEPRRAAESVLGSTRSGLSDSLTPVICQEAKMTRSLSGDLRGQLIAAIEYPSCASGFFGP